MTWATKQLVMDDLGDGLIGWTGYEREPTGVRQLASMGVGERSWALLAIASWLADETPPWTFPGDGPTDG